MVHVLAEHPDLGALKCLQSDTYLDLANKRIEVKTSWRPPLLEWSNQLFIWPAVSGQSLISEQSVIYTASGIRIEANIGL